MLIGFGFPGVREIRYVVFHLCDDSSMLNLSLTVPRKAPVGGCLELRALLFCRVVLFADR